MPVGKTLEEVSLQDLQHHDKFGCMSSVIDSDLDAYKYLSKNFNLTQIWVSQQFNEFYGRDLETLRATLNEEKAALFEGWNDSDMVDY